MKLFKRQKTAMEICISDACYASLLTLLKNKINNNLYNKIKSSQERHYIFNKKQIIELNKALEKQDIQDTEIIKFQKNITNVLKNKKRG